MNMATILVAFIKLSNIICSHTFQAPEMVVLKLKEQETGNHLNCYPYSLCNTTDCSISRPMKNQEGNIHIFSLGSVKHKNNYGETELTQKSHGKRKIIFLPTAHDQK